MDKISGEILVKVLHQVNGLDIGGVETFVYRLCKYSNETVGVFSHKDGKVSDWLYKYDIPIWFGDSLDDISEVVEGFKPDIVIFHTGSYLPSYAKSLKEKYPAVKFITVMHAIYRGDEWVDKIISISNAVHMENNPKKSVLIYPGCDYEETFFVGEVTRLAPYKHLEDLVHIAAIIKPIHPEMQFLIIGEEAQDSIGYKSRLEEMIKQTGANVTFLGYKESITYNNFDAFMHFVGHEAYPVTILEALQSNIPVITYYRKGTGEMFHPNLFHVRTPMEACNALHYIAQLRPKHMRRVAQEFSQVYEEVIK
jgi:glycosyltransferase involved in cell wall biosynthesis